MSDDKMNKFFSEIQTSAYKISEYSDKLRNNLLEIDSIFGLFMSGIVVFDPTPFLDTTDEHGNEEAYHWFFNNYGLSVKKKGQYDDTVDEMDQLQLGDVSRHILVESITRLIPFISLIAKEMKSFEKSMKSSVSKCNKILQCVRKVE